MALHTVAHASDPDKPPRPNTGTRKPKKPKK